MVDQVLAFEDKKIDVALGESTFAKASGRGANKKESNKDIREDLESNHSS